MVNVLGESGYDKLLRGVLVSTGTQLPVWTGRSGATAKYSTFTYVLRRKRHIPFVPSRFPFSGPYEQLVGYSTILL